MEKKLGRGLEDYAKLREEYGLSAVQPNTYQAAKLVSGHVSSFTYLGMKTDENLVYAVDQRGQVFWMHFGKHITIDSKTERTDTQTIADIARIFDMIPVAAKRGGRKIYLREKWYRPASLSQIIKL